jgi:hypothetical protein
MEFSLYWWYWSCFLCKPTVINSWHCYGTGFFSAFKLRGRLSLWTQSSFKFSFTISISTSKIHLRSCNRRKPNIWSRTRKKPETFFKHWNIIVYLKPWAVPVVTFHRYILPPSGQLEAVHTYETSVYYNETTKYYIPKGCNLHPLSLFCL